MADIYRSFKRSFGKHEPRGAAAKAGALSTRSEVSGSSALAPSMPDPSFLEDERAAPISGFRLKEYAGEGEGDGEDQDMLIKHLGESEESTGGETIKTGGWHDTRNDVDADGKYLLLAVPEFKKGMSTYLRLGAAHSKWESQLGHELEAIIHKTGPVGKASEAPFIDDERERGGAAVHPGVGATKDDSEKLHTKGGWRDHSDGNRITTTYGDKIEIIRGNYKMVVLGRQDEPADSAGWDASGQHIQDWGYSMPGASVTLEWQARYGGTWLQKNSTEIFHQWNRTAGDLKEEYWGDLMESYVGQEVPSASEAPNPKWTGDPGAPDPVMRNNPDIIEKTFAKSITSQTGSQVLPVPTIDETTFVTKSMSATTADETTDTTTVTGAITGTTQAGSISDTTTVDGSITSSTTASDTTDTTEVSGAISGTTKAGSISESTEAGTITGNTQAGTITEITMAGAVTSVELVGVKTEVSVGGARSSTEVVGFRNENFIGTGLSLSIGACVEINLLETKEINIISAKTWLNKVKNGLTDTKNLVTNSVHAATTGIVGTVMLGLAPLP